MFLMEVIMKMMTMMTMTMMMTSTRMKMGGLEGTNRLGGRAEQPISPLHTSNPKPTLHSRCNQCNFTFLGGQYESSRHMRSYRGYQPLWRSEENQQSEEVVPGILCTEQCREEWGKILGSPTHSSSNLEPGNPSHLLSLNLRHRRITMMMTMTMTMTMAIAMAMAMAMTMVFAYQGLLPPWAVPSALSMGKPKDWVG